MSRYKREGAPDMRGSGKRRIESNLTDVVDLAAHAIVSRMTPLEIGKMIHPDGEAVAFSDVPEHVLADHATRYSQKELKAGQFFKVQGKYIFVMDHEAKKARQQELKGSGSH
jgi:hypothetical protein